MIGSDPEIFITLAKEPTKVIPAFTIRGELSQWILTTPFIEKVFADGFAVEANLYPTSSPTHMASVLTAFITAVRTNGYIPYRKSFIHLSKEEMKKMNPLELELGCNPSRNAYNLPPLDKPGDKIFIRSTGMHLHWSDSQAAIPTLADVHAIVRNLDSTIGVLSVLLNKGLESPARRKFYGRPGEFRTRITDTDDLILEYRTLSSSCFSTFEKASVFTSMFAKVIDWTKTYKRVLWDDPTLVVNAIMRLDQEVARYCWNKAVEWLGDSLQVEDLCLSPMIRKSLGLAPSADSRTVVESTF